MGVSLIMRQGGVRLRACRLALQQRVGLSGERDNGNGSLMRIMPLAFADTSADDVRAASAITHAHAISMDACSSTSEVGNESKGAKAEARANATATSR